jgi:DNA-binding beta-propeller fold protein YncE
MRRLILKYCSPFLVVATALSSASSQVLTRQIYQISGKYSLSKPVCLSVSPSGSSFAVADQFADRIFVFDTDGNLRWLVGDLASIKQPTAVCLTGDEDVLFALKNSLNIYHAGSADLQKIDTVADLSRAEDKLKGIDRLVPEKDSSLVILDRASPKVCLYDANWKYIRTLASSGQGRGKIWSPTDIAVDLVGNVVISDERNYPIQEIDRDGSFLFFAGWNRPGTERNWEASTVGLDLQGRIWASDYTNAQWRLFDRTGNELERRLFDPTENRPICLAFTPDGQMIVVEDRGTIQMFAVTQ